MKATPFSLAGFLLAVALPVAASEVDELAEFLNLASAAEVVVLGEVHDNPGHHQRQAEIVAVLAPSALVFEMFPQSLENRINELRAEGAGRDILSGALEWQNSGWPDFAYYARVLEAAPEAYVAGAAFEKDDIFEAGGSSAAAAFGKGAELYGLDKALPEDAQQAQEALMLAAHCDALPQEALPGMVEVQRLRDAGLADAVLRARRKTGGGQVVVITGTGHADRLTGMPAPLARAAPDLTLAILGQGEGTSDDAQAYDAWLISPPPDREDPCAAFTAGND